MNSYNSSYAPAAADHFNAGLGYLMALLILGFVALQYLG